MKQVTITDRASEMIEAYRDEEHTDHIKARLLDIMCCIIDEAEINGNMSRADLRLLATISNYNDLITELSQTSE